MMNDEDIKEYHNIGKKTIWDGKPKFEYKTIKRVDSESGRVYDINDEKLPSVTTIWKQKVGDNKADKIRDDAAARGTIMHRIIEGFVTGDGHADLSDMGQVAGLMAQTVFDRGLRGSMDEIWGSEITLYYPGLYAGATDLCGIYEGRESIIDFKQSNKPKKREWIDDYFTQLAAYAMAHNYVYDTKIQSGIILIGKEFQHFMWIWLGRVGQYYKQQASGTKNP
jgi:hypothetical protein